MDANRQNTLNFTYDALGRMLSAGDQFASYAYAYDRLGRMISSDAAIAGLAPTVTLTNAYDAAGRRTQVATKIGGNADFVTDYAYDQLGRTTSIRQSASPTSVLPVADKRVDFTYDLASQPATLTRFADLSGNQLVAATDYLFDQAGRLTGMTHSKGASIFADYDWTFDEANRMTRFESLIDGVADYTNDDTGQLTGAEYTAGAGLPTTPPDEQYVYDENGNRLNNGYTVGPNNQLLSDGTHTYTYDEEGNRTSKTHIATGEVTEYHWDHRNRLTRVSTRATANGPLTADIQYAYDFGQRWIRKTLDTNADGAIEESRIFVHDSGQIVLDFQKTGTGDAASGDLGHRYLWGQHVDQLLADETVDTAAGDVAWTLTDHLNTVRDLVAYDPATDTTSVIKHIAYSAFGNVTSDSAPGIDSLFLFTARPYDPDTGLQNNLNRWYDLSTGRWMTEDPIGFEAADVNLQRYVGNQPLKAVDPSGLLTNIRFQAPRIDGTASVLADWQVGETCLDLYVDGVLRYSSNRTGDQFDGNFDYKWLKRGPGNRGTANGIILIRTNVANHSLHYTAKSQDWEGRDRQLNWAAIENLGLNLSVAAARGSYTRYGGAVHNQAAVWDTTIEVSAKWVYNRNAGDGDAVLQNAVSPFGADMILGERVDDGVYVPPPQIGENPRPSGRSMYTQSIIHHGTPLNQWFIDGATWETWYLTVSLIRKIDTGVGGTSFVDVLKFKLPGVPRPD
jgi:RHS repeat-associated protein